MIRRSHIITVTAILAIMALTDILYGTAGDKDIIMHLRVPRVMTAILSGAALALAGSQMQSVLRNPLADPHIMGVSSGAALGAAAATLWSRPSGLMQGLTTAGAAFAGALASATVILAVSRKFRSSSTLLIFGVMLGFIVNATVSILQFTSDAESLKIFYSWSAGSFSNTTWPQICIICLSVALGYILAFTGRKGLDIILFGDEFALMSGADPAGIRLRSLLSASILTGAVTAFCGPLGFVGIVAPHIAKAATGTSAHGVILPVSLLTGATLCLLADIIAQSFAVPLPIAGTLAITGIPVIIFILIKRPSL